MSPILTRPVREQLEHNRVIRALQVKWQRRYGVEINLGNETTASARAAGTRVYPDLVLTVAASGRRPVRVVEVETAESVNHLEAMSQWVSIGKVRAPFSLYVPVGSEDTARRLCIHHKVKIAELWTYHRSGGKLDFSLEERFTPVRERSGSKAKASRKSTARKPSAGRKVVSKKTTVRKSKTKSGRSATRKSKLGLKRR